MSNDAVVQSVEEAVLSRNGHKHRKSKQLRVTRRAVDGALLTVNNSSTNAVGCDRKKTTQDISGDWVGSMAQQLGRRSLAGGLSLTRVQSVTDRRQLVGKLSAMGHYSVFHPSGSVSELVIHMNFKGGDH